MMKLTRTVYNRCFSVPICILLMIGSMQGMFLCIGDDGHVAVKTIGRDCYGNLAISISREASKASLKEAFSSNKDNYCGPCIDIPISIGFVGFFKKPNRVNPMSLASTTISSVVINSTEFSKVDLASEPFMSTPYFTPLRTIILLI